MIAPTVISTNLNARRDVVSTTHTQNVIGFEFTKSRIIAGPIKPSIRADFEVLCSDSTTS